MHAEVVSAFVAASLLTVALLLQMAKRLLTKYYIGDLASAALHSASKRGRSQNRTRLAWKSSALPVTVRM